MDYSKIPSRVTQVRNYKDKSPIYALVATLEGQEVKLNLIKSSDKAIELSDQMLLDCLGSRKYSMSLDGYNPRSDEIELVHFFTKVGIAERSSYTSDITSDDPDDMRQRSERCQEDTNNTNLMRGLIKGLDVYNYDMFESTIQNFKPPRPIPLTNELLIEKLHTYGPFLVYVGDQTADKSRDKNEIYVVEPDCHIELSYLNNNHSPVTLIGHGVHKGVEYFKYVSQNNRGRETERSELRIKKHLSRLSSAFHLKTITTNLKSKISSIFITHLVCIGSG